MRWKQELGREGHMGLERSEDTCGQHEPRDSGVRSTPHIPVSPFQGYLPLSMEKKQECLSQSLWGWCGGLVAKSCPTLVTPWTVACQASLSVGSPRREYWSGLSFPSPGNLSDPGIKLASPALAGRKPLYVKVLELNSKGGMFSARLGSNSS